MKLCIGKPNKAWVATLACVGMLGLGATALTSASSAATARPMMTAAKKAPPLFLDVDTVSVAKANDCYTINNFAVGTKVLFRIKVFNGATGKVYPNYALKSVIVAIPGAPSFVAKYASHKTDSFWTVLWTIPASYPTGVVNYTVTARANSGQVGHYVPFNVTTASLTIVAS